MKHGKKPTVAQMVYIKSLRLNPENWLIVKDNSEEFLMVHRLSDKPKKLPPRQK